MEWKFGVGQTAKQEKQEIADALAAGRGDEYMRAQQQARLAPQSAPRRRRRRSQPSGAPRVTLPSPAEVAAAKTKRGGWRRATLASWGVPWPPPKGWRRQLEDAWRRQRDGQPSHPPPGWSGPVAVRFECPICGGNHPRRQCGRPANATSSVRDHR